mmetsp:Transcript_2363/g.3770  ORF Transcript_2363/g.3770 Transcript_2363/m.3770 type:complete len:321 (+) Transcript_2363:185-1147(+)
MGGAISSGAMMMGGCFVLCGANTVVISEVAANRGGTADGMVQNIKKSQQQRDKLQTRNTENSEEKSDEDAQYRNDRKNGSHKNNKKDKNGLRHTMGIPRKVGNGDDAPACRRQRSMSLEGTAFTATIGGVHFAKYTNHGIHHGMGNTLLNMPDEHDEDDEGFFSLARKKSFADPAAKKQTISEIRALLESNQNGRGERGGGRETQTNWRQATRARELRSGKKNDGAMREEAPRFGARQSSGDWSSRLGGNSALANQLDFLRDKGKEELTKRTATREATHKADMEKPDHHSSQAEKDVWRLRAEREDYWAKTAFARTASHH